MRLVCNTAQASDCPKDSYIAAESFEKVRPMWSRALFTMIGAGLSLWLVGILLFANPYPEFSAQGAMLMDMVWGRISLLDLYAGFFIGIALVWFLEPKLWVRWLITVATPLLGNPVLALWLVFRFRHLVALSRQAQRKTSER